MDELKLTPDLAQQIATAGEVLLRGCGGGVVPCEVIETVGAVSQVGNGELLHSTALMHLAEMGSVSYLQRIVRNNGSVTPEMVNRHVNIQGMSDIGNAVQSVDDSLTKPWMNSLPWSVCLRIDRVIQQASSGLSCLGLGVVEAKTRPGAIMCSALGDLPVHPFSTETRGRWR